MPNLEINFNSIILAGLLIVTGFIAGWAFRDPDKEDPNEDQDE